MNPVARVVVHPRLSRAAQTLLLLLVNANGCGSPAAGDAKAPAEPSPPDASASAEVTASAAPEASAPAPSSSQSPESPAPEGPPPMRVAIYGLSCIRVTEHVRFAAQSARVTSDDDTTLDALSELFTTYPELVLEVRGHADAWERNPKTLARQRAKNVRAALVRRGVREASMPLSSCGAELPIDGRGKPANRRVEFVIRAGIDQDMTCDPTPKVCEEIAK